MKLRAMYDSEDKIPSEVRDWYEERDGKFYLMLEGVRDHHEVSALSNAYRQEQTKRRDATTKLQAAEARLEGLPEDFNAAAYDELKAKADAGEGGTVDEKITALKTQHENKVRSIEDKNKSDQAKKDDEIKRLNGVIERNVIDGGLAAAMDEANIDPKHKKMLAPYLRTLGKFKVTDEDGKSVAMVETDMGEVALAKFVADWAGSDAGKDYVGKPAGLGTGGNSGGNKLEGNPFTKANWNKTAQGRIIQSDAGKAERMAKAAGFKSLDAAKVAVQAVQ